MHRMNSYYRTHAHRAVVLNLGISVGNTSLSFKNIVTVMFARSLSQDLKIATMVQSHTCSRVKSSECHLLFVCEYTREHYPKLAKQYLKNISKRRITPIIQVKMNPENSVFTTLLLSTDCSENPRVGDCSHKHSSV